MASILFIIAQQGFRDEELFEPKKVCENAGLICKVASITAENAIGKLGGVVKPDLAVKDVNADDFDLCAVIGGPGSPELANHKEVINLLNEFKNKGKKLAAICYAPVVLAKAGLLKNKKVTAYKDDFSVSVLKAGGAVLQDEDVVTDDDLVTGAGPYCAKEFGDAIVGLMKI